MYEHLLFDIVNAVIIWCGLEIENLLVDSGLRLLILFLG
jgi:hypothetical protein